MKIFVIQKVLLKSIILHYSHYNCKLSTKRIKLKITCSLSSCCHFHLPHLTQVNRRVCFNGPNCLYNICVYLIILLHSSVVLIPVMSWRAFSDSECEYSLNKQTRRMLTIAFQCLYSDYKIIITQLCSI